MQFSKGFAVVLLRCDGIFEILKFNGMTEMNSINFCGMVLLRATTLNFVQSSHGATQP